MNKKRLSLYLDNICNLKCSYCNVDYSKKRTFSDQDLLEWFEKNKEMIDMRQIKLCGGEPTLIYLSLFDFLDQFESIFMITNLYDEKIIDKWVKRFGEKLDLVVSFHDEVIDTQLKNIDKYIKYINSINIVLSLDNIDYIKKYLKIFLNKKIPVMFLPQLPINSKNKKNDIIKIKDEIFKLLNIFKETNNFSKLMNIEIVNNIKMGIKGCNPSNKISIFLNGEIKSCVCNTHFYISFNENEICKNSKYEDCKLCKKCMLHICNDGFINGSFDYFEYCEISKSIYDYISMEVKNDNND